MGSQTPAARGRISGGDEAWESAERDKLSGAVLSVRGGLLPKPELNSSGGGSDMGKA